MLAQETRRQRKQCLPLAVSQTSRRLCCFVTPARTPMLSSKTRCLVAWFCQQVTSSLCERWGGKAVKSPGLRDRIVGACRLFTNLPLHAGARARSQGLRPRRPSLDHAAGRHGSDAELGSLHQLGAERLDARTIRPVCASPTHQGAQGRGEVSHPQIYTTFVSGRRVRRTEGLARTPWAICRSVDDEEEKDCPSIQHWVECWDAAPQGHSS